MYMMMMMFAVMAVFFGLSIGSDTEPASPPHPPAITTATIIPTTTTTTEAAETRKLAATGENYLTGREISLAIRDISELLV